MGVGFLALAAYISFEALHDLITHELPRVSYFGIVYAAACIVVMPLLARAKRRVAADLDSDALHADSHQSDICAYLSGILLVGLGLNALFGWRGRSSSRVVYASNHHQRGLRWLTRQVL